MERRNRSNDVKIIVVGSNDVGKTTLMDQLIGKIGKVEYKGITTAIDYGSLELDGKKIHFFGTPGQKRFEFMRDLIVKGAKLALVVLDASKGLTNEDKDIINWLESKNIPYGVFINKIDIKDDLDKDLDFDISQSNNLLFITKGSAIDKKGLKDLLNNIRMHI